MKSIATGIVRLAPGATSSATATAITPTASGLRFDVRRMIARGGFATVLEALDRQHQDRNCAVKVFRRELVDNAWMTQRFQQESRLWSAFIIRISFAFMDTGPSAGARLIWQWSSSRVEPCAKNCGTPGSANHAGALEFDPSHRPNKAGDFGLRIADDLEDRG